VSNLAQRWQSVSIDEAKQNSTIGQPKTGARLANETISK
jgi:hypothetical protein